VFRHGAIPWVTRRQVDPATTTKRTEMGKKRREQKMAAAKARFKRECGESSTYFAALTAMKLAADKATLNPAIVPSHMKAYLKRRNAAKPRHNFYEQAKAEGK
jgi:hypothetical protein